MRLVTPQLEVKENDAFINDVLNRKKYGEMLLNIIIRSHDELVISLDGKWGEGKTTFIKMWQGLLSQVDIPNIYIDAFANDYVDDAFISIVSAIANYAETHVDKSQQERIDEFKNKAKKIGGQILSWSAKLSIRAATLGIIKDSDIEELSDIKEDLSKSFSNVVGKFIEDRINSHTKNIALIQSFRDTLSELPSKLQKGNNNPLVVIIDELDRCKPTFAVEIIENIKHLFSVKNVVFVLVMNKAQLEESVKSVYGMNIDAHIYLQKFINLETRLPKQTEERHSNDLSNYAQKLIKLHELQTWGDNKNILNCLEPLANHFNLSLRQLEKVFTNLAVFYGTSSEHNLRLVPLIVFLSVIKVINSQLFERLLLQRISYRELCSSLKLDKLDRESDWGRKLYHLLSWMRYAVLSNKEYNELQKDDSIRQYDSALGSYNISRERLIPSYAQQLNLFLVH